MSNSGLPHYRNSVSGMANWEPVYTSTYQVQITPPEKVGSWADFLMEEVKNVGGLETDQIPEASVEQNYKGVKRRFAGNLPPATTADIVVGFNVNVNENQEIH